MLQVPLGEKASGAERRLLSYLVVVWFDAEAAKRSTRTNILPYTLKLELKLIGIEDCCCFSHNEEITGVLSELNYT